MRTLFTFFTACMATAALADCIEGMREPTPGEIQFNKRVSAALKAALPAPPAGWSVASVREHEVGALCSDEREGAFEVSVGTSYTYRPPKEESDRLYAEHKKLQAQIDALRQLPPAVAAERQGWLDKMSQANRDSNRAAKEGNKALAKQKDAEAEEHSRKAREIRDAYLAKARPQVEELESRQKALQYGGFSISVALLANDRSRRRADAATASEVVVGRLPTPASPGLKVHNVRAIVEGSATPRAAIVSAIDKDKLARIVE